MSTPRSPARWAFNSTAASSSAMATTGGMNSRTWPTRSSWLVAAPRPTPRKRSGLRRTTSRACVPTDPVEPRMLSARMAPRGYPPPPTLFAMAVLKDQPKEVEGSRHDEQHRVDPVQDAAVTRHDRPHVLDTQVPLDGGLGQIAEGGEHDDHDAQQQSSNHRAQRVDLGHEGDGDNQG